MQSSKLATASAICNQLSGRICFSLKGQSREIFSPFSCLLLYLQIKDSWHITFLAKFRGKNRTKWQEVSSFLFQRVQVPEVRGDLLPGEREPPVFQEAAQVLPPSSSDSGRSAGESLRFFLCTNLSYLKLKTCTYASAETKCPFTFLQLQNLACRFRKIFVDVKFRENFTQLF
jgi:hypothetical protein